MSPPDPPQEPKNSARPPLDWKDVERAFEVLRSARKQFSTPEKERLHEELEKQIRDLKEQELSHYENVIISVLPVELRAVVAVFGQPHQLPFKLANQRYDGVTLFIAGQPHKFVIANILGDGQLAVLDEINRLVRLLPNLKRIAFVGIAAAQPTPALPEQDIRLGDVVISKSVVQYDHLKLYEHRSSPRGKLKLPGPDFVTAANRLVSYSDVDFGENTVHWSSHMVAAQRRVNNSARPHAEKDHLNSAREYLLKTNSHECRVHLLQIGSGNTLLRNEQTRDELHRSLDVWCFEMEGAAVAQAAQAHDLQYVVVRGITDYADGKKNDDWHTYSSLAAGAVTRALFELIL